MNNIVLIGRLTKDVELRYIPGTGTPVANLRIAVDREYKSQNEKKETDFIDVRVWNKAAENCANYISKGSKVAIQGSIRVDSYTNSGGEQRTYTYVNANRVQFLDSKSKSKEVDNDNIYDPSHLGSDFEYQAIDDDDIPF